MISLTTLTCATCLIKAATAEEEIASDSSIVKELYLIYTGIVLCVIIATCVYLRKNWTSTVRILSSQGWGGNKYAPVAASDPDQEKALVAPVIGVAVPVSSPSSIKGQSLAPVKF